MLSFSPLRLFSALSLLSSLLGAIVAAPAANIAAAELIQRHNEVPIKKELWLIRTSGPGRTHRSRRQIIDVNVEVDPMEFWAFKIDDNGFQARRSNQIESDGKPSVVWQGEKFNVNGIQPCSHLYDVDFPSVAAWEEAQSLFQQMKQSSNLEYLHGIIQYLHGKKWFVHDKGLWYTDNHILNGYYWQMYYAGGTAAGSRQLTSLTQNVPL